MKMSVATQFDPNSRALTVTAGLDYYTTGDANHFIVVLITEDGIVGKQTNYDSVPDYEEFYMQNHVLRGALTPGTWGKPVKGNTIILGEKFELTFDYTLPTLWVAENCHVVVYVHDFATKEVLQVEEVKLVP